MSEKQYSLLDSGAILAAITGLLYCVSNAKYEGYLSSFQLDADVLDRNFQQILYQGFIESYSQIFLLLGGYALVRFAFSHAILPGLEAWLKSHKGKRQYLKIKRRWFGKGKDSQRVRQAKKHTNTFAVPTIALLVLLMALVNFEAKGRLQALAILKKIDKKSISDQELITVQIENQPRKLVYLTCGARNCAGIDPNTKTVYYFPQNGHSYLLSTKKRP